MTSKSRSYATHKRDKTVPFCGFGKIRRPISPIELDSDKTNGVVLRQTAKGELELGISQIVGQENLKQLIQKIGSKALEIDCTRFRPNAFSEATKNKEVV